MKKIVTFALVLILTMTTLAFAAGINGQFKGFEIVNLSLNGQAVATQVPAVNFFGKTSIPVADAAKAMNVIVEWDAKTWTANLYNPSVDMVVCSSIDENASGDITITSPISIVEKGFSYDFSVYANVTGLKGTSVVHRFLLISPTGETLITDLDSELTFSSPESAKMGMFAFTDFSNASFSSEGEYLIALQIKHDGVFKTIGTTSIFAIAP